MAEQQIARPRNPGEAKETSALASHTSCSACRVGAVSGLESELVGLTGNALQELIAVCLWLA
jgi:hypothetical protein